MKAAILTTTGFEIRELETPTCGDDEILIKIIACGVCSGDVFVYQNRGEIARTPSRLGHEASGVIAAVGQKVVDFAPGDSVTTFGMPAYADYLLTTPDTVVKLPREIDPIYALGEPIACCVHAVNQFNTQSSDRVAVVGCGFMGLICLQLMRHQGADFICAIDRVEERLAVAKDLSADITINPVEPNTTSILEELSEFDMVIEAAGSQGALDLCTTLISEHGNLILIGYHQSSGGMRSIDMEQWNYKAINVINGHVRRMDEKLNAMRKGMELMAQGHVVTRPHISTYPLANITSAFTDLISGKANLVKAVILMDS
jgi:threonine dehydrogenase-like Zn-dependent dehydrogenase